MNDLCFKGSINSIDLMVIEETIGKKLNPCEPVKGIVKLKGNSSGFKGSLDFSHITFKATTPKIIDHCGNVVDSGWDGRCLNSITKRNLLDEDIKMTNLRIDDLRSDMESHKYCGPGIISLCLWLVVVVGFALYSIYGAGENSGKNQK